MENTNYPLQEKIQSFVSGDLDEAARRALLDQSGNDAATADELAFSQSLARALRHREMATAAAVLSSVIAAEGFPPPPTPSVWAKWGGWAIGTAFVLALLTAGYFWAESRDMFLSEHQKRSKSALEPLENVLFLPNEGEGLADLQSGMKAYDAGRYRDAARALTAYVAQRPDPSANVYLGVSHLLSGKTERAITPLTEAAKSPEPPVQEAALWYLALAYLADNQPDAARKTLEGIPPDSVFGEKAQTLLTDLK
jgi:TolA-binding protein